MQSSSVPNAYGEINSNEEGAGQKVSIRHKGITFIAKVKNIQSLFHKLTKPKPCLYLLEAFLMAIQSNIPGVPKKKCTQAC